MNLSKYLISVLESEENIKDEESFKEYAKNKFNEVYGDKLDEEKMNKIINGIINDNEESIEKNNWGKLVGILNKSFGK